MTVVQMHPIYAARARPAGDWIDGRPHVDGQVASLDRLGYLIAVYESRGYKPTLGDTAYQRMTAAGGGWARLAARLDRKETV
ncbi:hypothetical protein [Gordonia sp. UCD-TK1]|uniref:hypothetical protein n=1 Tax=Gordonia sp. UCD-TK1 TaxID=1857893 RepID=UPI00080DA41C|nr:hypothetical protein [Gordonia sp. UCD-TK1]OCH81029.1 hypothetical protein A9310_19920 [Gordonia sp. UCD-TK1]